MNRRSFLAVAFTAPVAPDLEAPRAASELDIQGNLSIEWVVRYSRPIPMPVLTDAQLITLYDQIVGHVLSLRRP